MQSSLKEIPVSAECLALWLDYLSLQPGFILQSKADGGYFVSAWPSRCWPLGHTADQWAEVIATVKGAHAERSQVPNDDLKHFGYDFLSGMAGILNYSAGACTVAGFSQRQDKPDYGDAGWVGQFDWSLHIKPDSQRAAIYVDASCEAPTKKVLAALIKGNLPPATPTLSNADAFQLIRHFAPLQNPDAYRAGVEAVLDLIAAGDCYQVNLAQQFSGQYTGNPFDAFRALVNAVPVPHAGYINAGDYQVLSISPERLLRISNRAVESKPIKGTRPRGTTPEQDLAYREDLLNAPKDRAENLMIVDLIRNDMSRFCEPFSVQVPLLFDVESYENVHQLVSTVTGTLAEGYSAFDALLSAFPGGSITGAPKRRSMEVIDALEPTGRGAYCGSLFYWDYNGNLDSNIAIRTMMTDSTGEIYCWGGCGIVADSSPEAEYQESLTKVQRLMDTLESL
ncbi:anthranilate synthase component I family protein [Marinobacter sp. 1Y8]